jgi:hypothetical protein
MNKMKYCNPWSETDQTNELQRIPFDDIVRIETYNDNVSHEHHKMHDVAHQLTPEPFHGDALNAPIVLLQANPGFGANDVVDFKRQDWCESMQLNLQLQHEKMDYPFTPLDPKFSSTTSSGKYWSMILKALIKESNVESVSKNVAVVELFPWHSQQFCSGKMFDFLYPSQTTLFNHRLVQLAIDDPDRIVICCRGSREWKMVTQRDTAKLIHVRNNRKPYISPANIGANAWEKLMVKIKN